jgi:hypothetical protein
LKAGLSLWPVSEWAALLLPLAAKNDVAVFITFISFLLLSDLAKPMPNRVESEKRLKIASVKEVIDCRAFG